MQPSLPKLAYLAILALLLTVTSGAQAQTPTALPPLTGDTGSAAFWINDKGMVVGNSRDSSNNSTAVVWDEHGTPRRLRPLIGDTATTAGGGNSINNKGEVAGFSRGGSSGTRAVVWSRNGTPTALGPGTGTAISNSGLVLGRSDVVVVWKKNGTFVELSEPGVPVTGVSINNRGEVAGDFSGAGVFTPLVWDHKGTLKSLSSFGGGASSINAKSEVAGFNIVGIEDNSDQRAVVWDRNGTATVLPPPSGDTRAAADGINQLGEVVGYSWTGSFVDTTAVVWDQDGNPTALPPLGGDTESMASGINKHGVVVGVSLDDNGNRTAVVWEWCGGDSC